MSKCFLIFFCVICFCVFTVCDWFPSFFKLFLIIYIYIYLFIICFQLVFDVWDCYIYIYMCVLFDVLELFCLFSHCFWHITWCFVFLLPFLGCWICLFNLLLFFQFRFKFFFPVDLFCWGVEFLFGLLDWFFGRFVSLVFF